ASTSFWSSMESSPFFSRTYAPITELLDYAPEMKMLAMDTSNLEAEGAMQLTAAWIAKFGAELKGLILAADDFSLTGALPANLVKTGLPTGLLSALMSVSTIILNQILVAYGNDIVAAGNSKTGMDAVKAGDVLAITYQSAEGDGALAVHSAARWFNGEKLDPVTYLPKHIITKADVDQFMPAQW
ncbi:MAG TPA: hypothetical protein PKO36_06075, partial [Candidatus Hydrogenedentes bacterium]|nr:hypothetical protein [Candidatus Hydrogenedentota bacterium]